MRLYDKANAIVLQGGAGGVMDARSRSRIPILVPDDLISVRWSIAINRVRS